MNRFENAIRRVGGLARPAGGGDKFIVSLQPERAEGDGHTETGTGFTHRFRLFTDCGGEACRLEEGSMIEYQEDTYRLYDIETVYLSGSPAYRRGTAVRVLKGEL